MKHFFLLFFIFSTYVTRADSPTNSKDNKSELFSYFEKKAVILTEQEDNKGIEELLNKSKKRLKVHEYNDLVDSLLNLTFTKQSKNFTLIKYLYLETPSQLKRKLKKNILKQLQKPIFFEVMKKKQRHLATLLLTMESHHKKKQIIVSTPEENKAMPFFEQQGMGPLLAILEPYKVEAISSGKSALSWSAKFGKIENVLFLIKEGCHLNQQDQWGWTALMYAAAGGHTEIVKILVKAEAETHTTNLWNETAYTLAKDLGYEKVLAELPPDLSPLVFFNREVKKISQTPLNETRKFKVANRGEVIFQSVFCVFSPLFIPDLVTSVSAKNQYKKIEKLIRSSYSYLKIIELDNPEDILSMEKTIDKFYKKYLKDFNNTRLTKKIIAAQIILATHKNLFKQYLRNIAGTPRGKTMYPMVFNLKKDKLYQNPLIVKKKTPHKGKTRTGKAMSSIVRNLFPDGHLAHITV